ncbi:MAG: tetratricopeptide repeat protein [Gemmatimonadetes bacterium]|nr:tetratricopeptide repeat protein [Gemmatimonadota bacterium]
MVANMGGDEAALKPLRGAVDAVAVLRGGSADPGVRRTALLQLTEALEASIRRLLRDDPQAPMELRLRALAPDELPASELMGELRRRDRISIELAAAFHELGARARRVHGGEAPEPGDVELALRTAERLEWEATAIPPAPPVPAPEEPVFTEDGTLVHPVRASTPAPRHERIWVMVALVLLLIAAVGLVLRGRADDRGLDEGVALFRSGDRDRATAQFRAYAEKHPKDPTPRLYLARIHRRAGRYQDALSELRLGLKAAPDDPGLHQELGFLLLDTGHPNEAADRFRTALRLDPKSSEAYIGMVRALRTSGRMTEAERVLAQAPPEVRALVASQPPVAAPGTVPGTLAPGTVGVPGTTPAMPLDSAATSMP